MRNCWGLSVVRKSLTSNSGDCHSTIRCISCNSSGTTGVPKCIVHGAGGTLLQLLKEHLLHVDMRRKDRLCYFTTCGWMMWNWMVNGLATGAALVLYEGSPFYPGPDAMFDLIDEQEITVFGTGAKAISAWQKSGIKPCETHSLESLETLLSPVPPGAGKFLITCIRISRLIFACRRSQAGQISFPVSSTGALCCRFTAAKFSAWPSAWRSSFAARMAVLLTSMRLANCVAASLFHPCSLFLG